MVRKKKLASSDKVVDNFVLDTLNVVKALPVKVINYDLAKQLTGTPKLFPESKLEEMSILLEKGIAADFGEVGWARGYLWHTLVRK